MKVELLRSHSHEPDKLQPCTSFVLNRFLALDAGCLGYALEVERQRALTDILITHAHSDHVGSLPVFVADVFPSLERPLRVWATRTTIDVLRAHVFNDLICPNFERIELLNHRGPALVLEEIQPRRAFSVGALRVTAIDVNHTVPTVGFLVEDEHCAVLFSGDTFATDELWSYGKSLRTLRGAYVDVSYPNEMEDFAELTKHLTPSLLERELVKLSRPDVKVLAMHLKPRYRERVVQEILALNQPGLSVAQIGFEQAW